MVRHPILILLPFFLATSTISLSPRINTPITPPFKVSSSPTLAHSPSDIQSNRRKGDRSTHAGPTGFRFRSAAAPQSAAKAGILWPASSAPRGTGTFSKFLWPASSTSSESAATTSSEIDDKTVPRSSSSSVRQSFRFPQVGMQQQASTSKDKGFTDSMMSAAGVGGDDEEEEIITIGENGKECSGRGKLEEVPPLDRGRSRFLLFLETYITGFTGSSSSSSSASSSSSSSKDGKPEVKKMKCDCDQNWAGDSCDQDLLNSKKACSPLDASCAPPIEIESAPCMGPPEDYSLDDPCADPRRKHIPYPPGFPPDKYPDYRPPPKDLFEAMAEGEGNGGEAAAGA